MAKGGSYTTDKNGDNEKLVHCTKPAAPKSTKPTAKAPKTKPNAAEG